jgi:hypothetical protein
MNKPTHLKPQNSPNKKRGSSPDKHPDLNVPKTRKEEETPMPSTRRRQNRSARTTIVIDGIRYNAIGDLHRAARLTLPNGLRFAIYPEKDRRTKRFLRRCNKAERQLWLDAPFGDSYWNDCCLVTVHVKHAVISVLAELHPPIPKYIRDRIRADGVPWLKKNALYVAHKNELHRVDSKEGQPIIEALKHGLTPEIYALMEAKPP